MDFNRIDLAGIRPGWGSVYQGGTADVAVKELPGPLLIVDLNNGELDETYIDHKNVEGVLAIWIDDSPDATLKDGVLYAFVEMIVRWLAYNGNAYVHCAAGISRSTYLDTAIHMAVLATDFETALAAIKAQRGQVAPNAGFVAQLKRLEMPLRALGLRWKLGQ